DVIRQAAGVLGQGVDNAVSVGELLDCPARLGLGLTQGNKQQKAEPAPEPSHAEPHESSAVHPAQSETNHSLGHTKFDADHIARHRVRKDNARRETPSGRRRRAPTSTRPGKTATQEAAPQYLPAQTTQPSHNPAPNVAMRYPPRCSDSRQGARGARDL